MKIAIVYDWIDKWGGVERILLALNKIFPKADFYSSYCDQQQASWAKDLRWRTSFIQNLPSFIKKNRLLSLPFYPIAFESLNLDVYDVVISVTSGFAKGIITKPLTYHVCYLLTPTRFLWVMPKNYDLIGLKAKLFSFYITYLKRWDYIAARRPDKIISISKTVADRCLKNYHLPSEVIYPPFDYEYWSKIANILKKDNYKLVQKFSEIKNKRFFLAVSRLEKYKRIDLVIKTFNKIKETLVIVGKGSQENPLKKMAKKNIYFYKDLTDEELGYLYQKADALIMPQEEDFGFVSLESQFFNCPVIAFKKGGATETVFSDKTGIFFSHQKEEEVVFAIERFKNLKYNLKKNLSQNKRQIFERFQYFNFKENFNKIIYRRI